MTHVFIDKADVSIFYGLALVLFTDIFLGSIAMGLYSNPENAQWYKSVSSKIKGMPPKILFPIVWITLYIGIFIGMFLYYRNETFPNSGYMIDTITLIFVPNIMLIKTWGFMFFALRKTTIALVTTILILILSTIMTVLFGVWELWGPFVPFLLLSLWSCYALYLVAMWVHVEKNYL